MKVLIKFKVGDKVRIKKDLVVGKDYGVINLQHYMKEDLGKESVVTGVYCRVNNRACTYKLSGSSYAWSEEMLESVEEKYVKSINTDEGKDYSTKYKDTAYKLGELLERKNNDYGSSTKKSFDRLGVVSLASRLYDKYNRFEQLAVKGVDQKVNDESVIDTLMDLAGYAIQSAVILEECYKSNNKRK